MRADSRPVRDVWHLTHKMPLTPRTSEHFEVLICRLEPQGATGDERYSNGDSDELFLLFEGLVDLQLRDQLKS